MNNETSPASEQVDPAAVFASASSLWEACHKQASHNRLNLSEPYNGIDQLMRIVMRIGTQFEEWSCQHINFKEMTEVWPYFLEEKFGEACLQIILPTKLDSFDERDCLRVAMRLHLPMNQDEKLPIPLDAFAENPMPNSEFRKFRIQTVRDTNDGEEVIPYTMEDEPFDDQFSELFFGLYGVFEDGTLEHIADRRTYSEALSLVKKLAPGIGFSELR